MVWAEMVMGRNGHGPKWLSAEMTSDLFKPSFFVSSYGTVLMFSLVVWLNMCGDRSLFLFTKFSFTETS